jgi:hypothetical protein
MSALRTFPALTFGHVADAAFLRKCSDSHLATQRISPDRSLKPTQMREFHPPPPSAVLCSKLLDANKPAAHRISTIIFSNFWSGELTTLASLETPVEKPKHSHQATQS